MKEKISVTEIKQNLNEQKMIEEAKELIQTAESWILPLNAIKPPSYVKMKIGGRDKLLPESLRQFGYITPIVVNERSDGTYVYVDGEERGEAMLTLGIEEVEVRVINVDVEKEKRIRYILNERVGKNNAKKMFECFLEASAEDFGLILPPKQQSKNEQGVEEDGDATSEEEGKVAPDAEEKRKGPKRFTVTPTQKQMAKETLAYIRAQEGMDSESQAFNFLIKFYYDNYVNSTQETEPFETEETVEGQA